MTFKGTDKHKHKPTARMLAAMDTEFAEWDIDFDILEKCIVEGESEWGRRGAGRKEDMTLHVHFPQRDMVDPRKRNRSPSYLDPRAAGKKYRKGSWRPSPLAKRVKHLGIHITPPTAAAEECFARWLLREAPTNEGTAYRVEIVEKLTRAIIGPEPHLQVAIFGSLAYRLFIRRGDIDLIIADPTALADLSKDEAYAKLEEISKRLAGLISDIDLISGKVALLKCTDVMSGISVDISLQSVEDARCGAEGVHLIMLIVKQMLRAGDLHEPFYGGIGGMTSVCLVSCFLEIHPTEISFRYLNRRGPPLGEIIFDFLIYYQTRFDTEGTGISAAAIVVDPQLLLFEKDTRRAPSPDFEPQMQMQNTPHTANQCHLVV
ncbi:hypothetical protein BDK51DRAFT_29947 [Blyttiomyces helicus]|uniref:Poly(A) RNA polymerase mitochondrial-like central palm domain-containing protein n=1 Tax=Blyttiomyces helicus TaxID=388810 RepID=A0A4P9WQB3_9FUNG|nr:hypothetical protein BDK51DRAFT_29947 [Blyttiomyces helicus]|eukprot:RKO93400.1 hypothetical protein BDK51DRAFT_29947 [Blyttiomyces helicus]